MFSLLIRRTATRAFAVVLLLVAGAAGARTLTFAPSDTGKVLALEGKLDVRVEDYRDGHSRTRHFLDTPKGRVELTFVLKPAQSLSSGAFVRVRGKVQGNALALDGGNTDSLEVVSTILPNTMGGQSIAVMMVNFQDDTSQPKTLADARTLVFGDTSAHYLESSFGQTWFTGEVYGWFTVAMSKTECDPERLATLADAQAKLAGVNLANFQRRVYMFPANACPWQGLGALGGTQTQAWVNGVMTLQVVGHELGHNYGLFHAHAYDCDTGVFGENCSRLDYGDAADLMGNNRTGQFNPFEKEQLGWLNDGISPPITLAATSGRYVIEPYSADTVGPKAIKIPVGKDFYGRTVYYYLEYRQPIGADSVLATAGNLTQGVIVRSSVAGDGESSYQLDMSPGSSTKFAEMADGALAVGQTHYDESAGVKITLASISSTGAAIDVQFVAPCSHPAPTLTMTSGEAQVDAGTPVDYTVTLTNKDSIGCEGSTTFTLWIAAPVGWASTLDTTNLTLLPGASVSVPVRVTSPGTAAPSNYSIRATVSSPLGSRHASSTAAPYSIVNPDITCVRAAPTIALTGGDAPVVAGTAVGYTLALTNRDSSACTATIFNLAKSVPSGWAATLAKSSATLAPGATTSTTLSVTSSTTANPGTYGIGAAAASVVGAKHTVNASARYTTIPKLSIADASVIEGHVGTPTAKFVVSLAQPAAAPVVFDVATQNGTALAGSDFKATALTRVTIPAGGTSTTVSVPIITDMVVEADEMFRIVVANVVGAVVADGTAIGTIRNDDTSLMISDVRVVEGRAGTTVATFTVNLANRSASPVTFNIATANKTAMAGSDYAALNLVAQSIPAGSTSRTFNVAIVGDALVETDETFFVNVSGVKGAAVVDAQAVGTIRNDDTVLTIADASIAEGNSGAKTLNFTVKLSAPSANPVTFNLATANKTATAGSDYVALALAGQSMPAGTTSKVFKVTINGDAARESNETFLVSVGNIVGATAGDAYALGTISNDD